MPAPVALVTRARVVVRTRGPVVTLMPGRVGLNTQGPVGEPTRARAVVHTLARGVMLMTVPVGGLTLAPVAPVTRVPVALVTLAPAAGHMPGRVVAAAAPRFASKVA